MAKVSKNTQAKVAAIIAASRAPVVLPDLSDMAPAGVAELSLRELVFTGLRGLIPAAVRLSKATPDQYDFVRAEIRFGGIAAAMVTAGGAMADVADAVQNILDTEAKSRTVEQQRLFNCGKSALTTLWKLAGMPAMRTPSAKPAKPAAGKVAVAKAASEKVEADKVEAKLPLPSPAVYAATPIAFTSYVSSIAMLAQGEAWSAKQAKAFAALKKALAMFEC
jgi:hypothetical protein